MIGDGRVHRQGAGLIGVGGWLILIVWLFCVVVQIIARMRVEPSIIILWFFVGHFMPPLYVFCLTGFPFRVLKGIIGELWVLLSF